MNNVIDQYTALGGGRANTLAQRFLLRCNVQKLMKNNNYIIEETKSSRAARCKVEMDKKQQRNGTVHQVGWEWVKRISQENNERACVNGGSTSPCAAKTKSALHKF